MTRSSAIVRYIAFAAVLAIVTAAPAQTQPAATSASVLRPSDLIAVCGDSITEQKDYSVDIAAYLLMCQPTPVRIMQFGWGGDSMGWLFGRGGDKDILSAHPTVITTCYGMNDGGYGAPKPEIIKRYRDGMNTLMMRFKQGGARVIVVGSPGCVDADTFRDDPAAAALYNQTLGQLSDVARQVAQENGCLFADVHTPMMDVMTKAKAKYGKTYHLAGQDGVHPDRNGHLVMAYAFLKALGCDGDIGTIQYDAASHQAQATAGHKVLSAAGDSIQIESSRYPYCFRGDPQSTNATTGVIEFLPFNQDLNRFRLIVTNAPAQQMRITWGAASKTFPADALAQGINLAAEFLDNPFSAAFRRTEAAVRQQQEFQTTLYKGWMANVPAMRQALQESDPDGLGSLDRIGAAMLKRDATLATAAAATVEPVQHTIRIEPAQ